MSPHRDAPPDRRSCAGLVLWCPLYGASFLAAAFLFCPWTGTSFWSQAGPDMAERATMLALVIGPILLAGRIASLEAHGPRPGIRRFLCIALSILGWLWFVFVLLITGVFFLIGWE